MDVDRQLTNANSIVNLNINADPKPFFVKVNATLDQHIQGQTANSSWYLTTLFSIDSNSVQIGQKTKAHVLAGTWVSA